ncbi:MAG: tRNA guanosine(34) transglycosylase Tgt [Acidobacteria bacterium]|nr:MAG: tRNA guanosine(34) transglycosylase Tgt [Acidobacteriota bacterium]
MQTFTLKAVDKKTKARRACLKTAHGKIETPVFMPVGTQGTVKGLTPRQIDETGAQIILGNTYHLMLRPGSERIRQFGGLHRFMSWQKPILTDSGGFQVFSLAGISKKTEEGVNFASHIDGSRHMLTPERSIAIQADLGSDIVMAFDDCPPGDASYEQAKEATERTHRWARRCLEAFKAENQLLFGIVQGGMFEELREMSAAELNSLPFAGMAIGGLSVGESKDVMYRILRHTAPLLPDDKPRYLMGVGTPADLVNAVSAGVDMFDCVMPTRNARNGQAFTHTGTLNIKQARFREDQAPLDSSCSCYTCRTFIRAYLHHLYRAGEILSSVLMTLHNISFYQKLMQDVRNSIEAGEFHTLQQEIIKQYGAMDIAGCLEEK